MPAVSSSRLVLIPSYNTGPKLLETVAEARSQWNPVWVVIDGSTDGSGDALREATEADEGVRVFTLPRNSGKGAAVFHGLREAVDQGFTHLLTMDSDGQHPAASLPEFMQASEREPDAMILGRPVFDASAPQIRVRGRKISNWWVNLETPGHGIADSLFGLRVYPAKALLRIMSGTRWMRRFDFDADTVMVHFSYKDRVERHGYFLEGKKELIDVENEWFYEPKTGMLSSARIGVLQSGLAQRDRDPPDQKVPCGSR